MPQTRSAVQDALSVPVKPRTSDSQTAPVLRLPRMYCAVLATGLMRQAMKYQAAFSNVKDGVTDLSRISVPVES